MYNEHSVIVNRQSTLDTQDAFARAVAENIRTSIALSSMEAMCNAVQDTRLGRQHLRIIAFVARGMGVDGISEPNRDFLASTLQISLKTLRNRIYELRQLGYLVGRTNESGQSIAAYTWGDSALDHEEIRNALDRYIAQLKSAQPSLNTGTPNIETVPAGRDASHNTGTDCGKSVPKYRAPSQDTGTVDKVEKTVTRAPAGANKESPTEIVISKGKDNSLRSLSGRSADLLDDVDPPAPVEIRINKTCISYKPLGESEFLQIRNNWIEKQAPKNAPFEMVRQFVALEIESYFSEPPAPVNGRPVRLMGFVVSGFQHRFTKWRALQVEQDAGVVSVARRKGVF